MPESSTASPKSAADEPTKSTESAAAKQGKSPGKSLDKQGGGALHTEHGTTTIA